MENDYPAKDKTTAPQDQQNVPFALELKEFKQELIIAGYSEKTLKMYQIYMREVLKFIAKDPQEITERDLIGYLATKKEKGCSNATLSLIHAAMKYFFKTYLKRNNYHLYLSFLQYLYQIYA